MPTEADLLDTIDACPDDDAPRLAHADWLAENGDPQRAEYVRIAVAAAHWPYNARHEVRQRMEALLDANRSRWLADRPEKRGMEWKFVRGYPEEVRYTSLSAFASTWRRALVFPVRLVKFENLRDMARLADEPGLAAVRCLGLSKRWGFGDEALRAILASPHLVELEELTVSEGRHTAATLALIATHPKLSGLRVLGLWGGVEGPAPTADDIAGLLRLSGLHDLHLPHWKIGGEAGRALWAARLPELRELYLFGNCLAGLPGLGDGGNMPALQKLDLSCNELGDDEAEALARATGWPGLRELVLWRNLVGERGVRALVSAPHLGNLRRLVLHKNSVGDGGARAIAESAHLRSLETLDVSQCLVGDAGMAALGRSTTLPALRDLFAEAVPARPDLVKAVAARFRDARPPLAEVRRVAVKREEARPVGDADEDALVRAILSNPWDDLARSAYADWLEERGAAGHAELLRGPSPSALARLHPRIVEAFGKIGTPRVGAAGLLTVPMGVGEFVKKAFQARAGDALRDQHVARLDLDGGTKDWTKVGDAPALAHLRALGLGRTSIVDDGAAVLAGCAGMASLCSLSLRGASLTERGVLALCGSANLGRLVHLALPAAAAVTAGVFRAIASGPLAGRLRHLDATGGRVSDEGLAALLASPEFLAPLTALVLPGCWLGNRGVMALADTPLPALRSLDLSRNSFERAGVEALAGSGLLRQLRCLKMVRGASRGPDFYQALVRAAADVPRLVVVLSKELPGDAVMKFRDALGDRLVLE